MAANVQMLTPTSNLHFISISLFLLFFSSSYPWLSASQNTVKSLPGFPAPLPFYLETGYVSVGEKGLHQLFYYFIESERNPREDPLLLWINGGPGCSSLVGFLKEMGPLHFNYVEYDGNLPTLKLNPHSWTKVANIIYLDSPVGTGFSYSTGSNEENNTDTKAAKEAHEFLHKWLMDHPRYFSNPLYIGGDSYSGYTVPIVTQEISNGIKAGLQPLLNLKGYLVGNPVTDASFDVASKVPYLHGMGIISDELYESAMKNCKGVFINPSNPKCAKDLQIISQFQSELNKLHILDPKCPLAAPKPKRMEVDGRRSLDEDSTSFFQPQPAPHFGCREYVNLLMYYWANNNLVQKFLHIRKGTVKEWIRAIDGLQFTQDVKSAVAYHVNLTTQGYRALIYSGDHDPVVPFVGTKAWIRSLNFPIIDDWRSWHVDEQVAGYTRVYANNLTFATIKGAGHEAPLYKPRQCFLMFSRWTSHKPL